MRALKTVLALSTQRYCHNYAGEIACKKYVQTQTLFQVATTFLELVRRLHENNFDINRVTKCTFNFSFPDIYFANMVEREMTTKLLQIQLRFKNRCRLEAPTI